MTLHLCSSGVTRRSALLGTGATLALARIGASFAAAPTASRLVVINVRGGLDGLAAVAPYGDPNLAKLRAPLMAPAVGKPGGMLYLGGFFGMHPSLATMQSLYASGQALVVHAVGNCALTRSHFEGQDYLQCGAPSLLSSGWVNRVAALMPAPQGNLCTAVAIEPDVPLSLRGAAPVAGWCGTPFPALSTALRSELAAITQPDPLLGPALSLGLQNSTQLNAAVNAAAAMPARLQSDFGKLGYHAGSILAAANGPRIATLETQSVDTHADQANRLVIDLSALDDAIYGLRAGLGSAWANTVVMTMTEFGRTAAVNGTQGTDHGTAFAMFLAGGPVAGGKVYAKWPGLSPTQLFQGRDLAPTVDFRSVAATVLQQHMGLPGSAMATVFPGAAGLTPIPGLLNG
jgi:uncharacterized protein (DUF1501 family)